MKKFKVYVKSETLLHAGRHFTKGKELLPCPPLEIAKELEKANLVDLVEIQEAPIVKKVEPVKAPEKEAPKPEEVKKPDPDISVNSCQI